MRRKTEEKACRTTDGRPGGGQAAARPAPGAGPDAGLPEEEPDGAPEKQTGEDPGTAPEEQPEDAPDEAPQQRIAALEQQLLDARCRLAAFAAGISPELVGDAVTLAVQGARSQGDVTEESVTAAMEQVLARHPGWKAGARRTGGFRLGADTEDHPRRPAPVRDEPKRWNRFR